MCGVWCLLSFVLLLLVLLVFVALYCLWFDLGYALLLL